MSGSNSGMGKMHLDLYTNNAALTQKARFWCNFVSSLKGEYAATWDDALCGCRADNSNDRALCTERHEAV